MHPFRFGVQARSVASSEAWAALARRAEQLGYSALTMPDHMTDQLAPIAALMAAAAATRSLRVGTLVFANDLRHPLVLAREVATIDVLSGGRFELGIGAGWRVGDYRQLGVAYDPPPVRVDRLSEAVPLLKRLLAGETVEHDGRHYRLDRATVQPRPVQRPRPPLLIGGGGPRVLRLAAREADIVGLVPQWNARGRPMVSHATERATAEKVAIIRAAAGPRFDDLELNLFVADAGLVGRGPGPLGSLLTAAKWSVVGLVSTPYVLYGTLDRLRERLLRRRERLGISYYSLPAAAMETMAPLVEALAGR